MSRRLTLLVMVLVLPGMPALITGATAQTPTVPGARRTIKEPELQPIDPACQGGLFATAAPFRFSGIVVPR